MAWQFNNTGFGKAIGDGIASADASIAEEKARLRQQALDDLAGADKYKKRKVDVEGNTIGYETDTDAKAKAVNFLKTRLPGYLGKAGSPATTIKPYQDVMKEQGLNPATGAPAAPPPLQPLLADPNKAKMEEAAADRELDMSKGVLANEEAEKARQHDLAKTAATTQSQVQEADKDREAARMQAEEDAKRNEAVELAKSPMGAPTGTSPSGKKYVDQDRDPIAITPQKQELAFGDRSVTGKAPLSPDETPGVDPSLVNSAPAPEPIDVPGTQDDPLDVDDYTLRRLIDMTTTPASSKNGTQQPLNINSSQLPVDFQKRLGVEGLSIDLPFSYVSRGIQASLGADKNIPAETYDAVAELEAGVPYSTVARKLGAAYEGKIPPQVAQELRSAASRIAQGEQRVVTNQAREEAQTDKKVDKQDRALERFRTAYDKTGILSAIAPLEILEKETGVVSGKNVQESKLPGQGTNALRALPIVGNMAATLAAKNYGGEATQQALQALVNAEIRTTSGQAVTKYEEGRNLIKTGIGPGGDEKDVTRGIQMMVQGLKEAGTSVRSSFPGEVISDYTRNGGSLPKIVFGDTNEKGGMQYNINPKKEQENKAPPKNASEKRIEAAKKFGIDQKKLDAIAAPNPDVKEWADQYGKTYDEAYKYLKARGDI